MIKLQSRVLEVKRRSVRHPRYHKTIATELRLVSLRCEGVCGGSVDAIAAMCRIRSDCDANSITAYTHITRPNVTQTITFIYKSRSHAGVCT